MSLRFRNGLPRGGIGYLGLAVGAGALWYARYGADQTSKLIVAALAIPLCVWLGLGLRLDGEAGEVADQVIWETRRRNDWFDLKDHLVSEFRISSAVILLGLVALGVALWRKYATG